MSRPRVFLSPLTGRAYFSMDYREDNGRIVTTSKHDVTDDVVRDLMAAAWDEGHDECCAVYVRHCAFARNPYRERP